MPIDIDIDSLTIAQAREIAAIFGGATVASPSLLSRHIGSVCVVRSHLSGVWLGTVTATDSKGVVLADARRAYSWTGAATCSGLATHGPSGGKITAPVGTVTIAEVIEVVDTTGAARDRWAAVPSWVA